MKLVKVTHKYASDEEVSYEVDMHAVTDDRLPDFVTYKPYHDGLVYIEGKPCPFWRKDPWSTTVVVLFGERYYRLPLYCSVGTAFVEGADPAKRPRFYRPRKA